MRSNCPMSDGCGVRLIAGIGGRLSSAVFGCPSVFSQFGTLPSRAQLSCTGNSVTLSTSTGFSVSNAIHARRHSSQNVFIDNGKVYILRPAEALTGQVISITDASGLLETPRRDEGFLSVTTLLEPGINIGEQIAINSTIQTAYNGQYKVAGIQHQGMISGAVCGEARSVFSLVAATFFKQGLVGVKPQ